MATKKFNDSKDIVKLSVMISKSGEKKYICRYSLHIVSEIITIKNKLFISTPANAFSKRRFRDQQIYIKLFYIMSKRKVCMFYFYSN